MAQPNGTPRDDALIFSLNTPDNSLNGDDGDGGEDPVGRGQAPANRLDMYRIRPPKPPLHGTRGGNTEPIPFIRLTPGAHRIP